METKDKFIEEDFKNWLKNGCMGPNTSHKKIRQITKQRKKLISTFRPKHGDKIVDLGSGLGDFIFDLEKKYPNRLEFVGVDLTNRLIIESQRRAKRFKNKNIRFVRAGIDKMKLRRNTYDYAFSIRSFHHFYRPVTMLRKIRVIMNNGGKFTILDWCRDFKEVSVWDKHFRKTKKSHYMFFTLKETKRLLKKAKFRNISGCKKDRVMIVTAYK